MKLPGFRKRPAPPAPPPPPYRVVGDLADLPTAGFRLHGVWGWAGLGFMLIEGMGFALIVAAYIYLMNGARQWPLADPAPSLTWGTANLALMLGSLVPNALVSKSARLRDVKATRFWTLIMAAIAAVVLVVRGFEFTALNTRWDQDAYGSIVWGVMVMHTTHLLTDFADTFFLTVFQHTHPVDNERLADSDDNASYWTFIVAWWVVCYAFVYWGPRWAP